MGFIAYSHGDDTRHHYTAIWPEAGARFCGWRWLVRIDPPDNMPSNFTSGVLRNGVEPEKKAAADAATVAWPEVVEDAGEVLGVDGASTYQACQG